MLKKDISKKGFTIIEIVLVLAIAGLIFLMVFLALPALQRSQRDTQRKKSATSIIAAYDSQRANNRGVITSSYNRGINQISEMVQKGYIDDGEVRDPSTNELYKLDENAWGGKLYHNYDKISIGSYGYDAGGYCEGNTPKDISGVAGYASAVIVIPLESGGWICASNYNK